MNQIRDKIWALSGIVAPIWLLLGVAIASSLYPGYSQLDQVLSELGAKGSPTKNISPFINNYPLSVLFLLFGLYISRTYRSSSHGRISGYLIALHGLGTLIAGYFPCDFECPADSKSINQIIHGIAGGSMFLSLTAANFIWGIKGKNIANSVWLQRFSLLCAALSVLAVLPMQNALAIDQGAGLYQRLNYGISLVWVFVLSGFSLQKMKSRSPPNQQLEPQP